MTAALSEEESWSNLPCVVIARTAAEVFQYVADLRNDPNWHVDIATVPRDFVQNLKRALES